jgi:hypothetical protein
MAEFILDGLARTIKNWAAPMLRYSCRKSETGTFFPPLRDLLPRRHHPCAAGWLLPQRAPGRAEDPPDPSVLGGGEEEVRVDATLVDDALPPTRSGAETGGPPRFHISVRVEVSKAARPGVLLTFMCSAWPDEMEAERVFPVRASAAIHGGQFR